MIVDSTRAAAALLRHAGAALAGGLSCVAMTGCAAAAPPVAPTYPTPVARRAAMEAMARAAVDLGANRDRTLRVTATIGVAGGPSQRGRGFVAVRHPSDVRMQLLGPGGLTALDVWIAGPHDRMVIPAISRVEQDSGGAPGRPHGFLRWWLLAPLSGRVLWVEPDGHILLRALDGALVSIRLDHGRMRATRTTPNDVEHLDAELVACGRATWRSERADVAVAITCEAEGPPAPAKAFEEPR